MTFEKIAPLLKDPLILIGFFLFITFLLIRILVTRGIIPVLRQTQGFSIVKLILQCGFVIGLVIIVLGFVLKYKELSESEQKNVVSLNPKDDISNTCPFKELGDSQSMEVISETIVKNTRFILDLPLGADMINSDLRDSINQHRSTLKGTIYDPTFLQKHNVIVQLLCHYYTNAQSENDPKRKIEAKDLLVAQTSKYFNFVLSNSIETKKALGKQEAFSISGFVYRDDNTPLEAVLLNISGHKTTAVMTDARGSFSYEFKKRPPDNLYTISFIKDGFRTVTRNFTEVPKDNIRITLTSE